MKYLRRLVISLGYFSVLLLPTVLKAQELSLGLEFGGSVGLGSRDLRSIITSIIQVVLGFLGLALVVLVAYAGYILMTANGDSEKVQKGKKTIVTALVGLLIVLSSYAIVSFVLKNISESTGSQGGGSGSGGNGDPIGTVSSFQPSNIYPYGRLSIRNVTINIRFNKPVNPQSITENSVFVKKINENGEYENVSIQTNLVEPNKIAVKATALCPDNPDINCFDFNASEDEQNKHLIELAYQTSGAVIDINGKTLECLPNSRCQGEFIVGSEVDTKGPNVSIKQLVNTVQPLEIRTTNPNASVSVNGSFIIEASAKDTSGVSEVKFFNEKDDLLQPIGVYTATDILTYVYAKSGPPGLWSTSDLAIGSKHKLIAVATDLAGNVSTSSSATITIKPAHCFNNELDGENDSDVGPAPDQPETGVDCGGICGACPGQSCNANPEPSNQCVPENSLCASSVCGQTSCVCSEVPVITSISPSDGAPGNWVTIMGRNFGNLKGNVKIDDQSMEIVETPECLSADSWNNNYVIAVIPSITQGVKNISIETKSGSISNLKEFTVNQTKRPGICALDKADYEFEDKFVIFGHQFGSNQDNRKVILGSDGNEIEANNLNFQINSVEATVPNVAPGKTAVRVELNGEKSNGLPMTIKESTQNQLRIINFFPKSGAKGQYVTIIGSGFGNLKNNSQVYFGGGKTADFDFPNQCGANYWNNNVIIAKVPEVVNPEDLTSLIKITVNGQTVESAESFTINNKLPVSPGLCSLYPKKSAIGSEIDVAGDNLSNTALRFKNGASAVTLTSNNGGKVIVPENSETGDVIALNISNPALTSNPIPFEVSSQSPNGNANPNYYQWQFKTCSECYRPKVVVIRQCSVGTMSSPTPIDGSEENFVDASLQLTFDRLMDQDSLNADGALMLEKCLDNPNRGGTCIKVETINLSATVLGNGVNEHSLLVINKSESLDPYSWYRVTIVKARSVEGIDIGQPFSWSFKTRANNLACTPDALSCAPSQASIAYLSSLNLYARSFDTQTCNICSDIGPWDWQTVNESVLLETSSTSKAVITGLEEDNNTGAKVKNLRNPSLSEALCKIKVRALAPKIIIDNKCDVTIQSPTPFMDSTDICPDALIGVRFSERMNANSISRPDAFAVKGLNGVSIATQFHSFIYDDSGWEIGALIKPLQSLEVNTRYNVSVNTDVIRSAAYLPLDFTSINNWWFTTGSSSNCQIKSVLVNPAKKQIDVNQSSSYKSLVTGVNCQTLIPSQTGWQWRTTDTGVASITNSISPSSTLQSLNAGITYVRARFAGRENVGENGMVNVGDNNSSFRITKVEPLGENICTNALVKITFSKPLIPETVGTRTIKMSSELQPKNIILSANKLSVVIDKPLLSSTEYQVSVLGGDKGVFAFDGSKLKKSGCSIAGLTWDNEVGCQWNFKTGTELCVVKNIEIEPISATLLVGENQIWEALAYSQAGQLLSDKADWSIIDSSLLSFTNGSSVGLSRYASTTAIAAGSTQVQATIGTISKRANVIIMPELIGPRLTTFLPISPPPACQNALISMKFDEKINEPTINNNIKVYYQSEACNQINSGGSGGAGGPGVPEIGKLLPDNKYIQTFYSWLSFASRYIGGDIVKSIADFIVIKAFADDPWCVVDGVWSSASIRGSYELNFKQASALPKNAIIRVEINGSENGLLGEAGLPVTYSSGNEQVINFGNNKFGWQFQTGNNICSIGYVDVYSDSLTNKKNWLFNRSENDISDDLPSCSSDICDSVTDGDKVFKAIAKTSTGQEIVSIENVYSWSWIWRSSNPSSVGLKPAEKPAGNVLSDQQVVIAENVNGDSLISATAMFPPSISQQPITGSVTATVFLCANPWPKISEEWIPYTDNKFNFSLMYCRDAGITGTQDDLPELKYPGQNFTSLHPFAPVGSNYLPVCLSSKDDYCRYFGFDFSQDVQISDNVVSCATLSSSSWVAGSDRIIDSVKCVAANNYVDYNEQTVGVNDMLRQYLLGVPGTVGDAIAVRVYENNYLNNASDWYKDKNNIKNQGSPKIITDGVNGYPAVQDDRSTYVSFANQLSPANQPNQAKGQVLIVSYNQDASEKTVSIVNQLVKNIKFNTNISNIEQENKVKRDFVRVSDLQSIAKSISTSTPPVALSGGTYVPGMSLSVWPSWRDTLSSQLSTVLPKDPLNKLGSCGDCVNVNDYSIDFEKPNDESVFQGVNSMTQKACSPTDPVLQGKCSLRLYGRSINGNESGIARTFNLSSNTTYQVSANVYMSSSTPEVIVKLHNDSNSIMKTKTIEPSNKGEWKNVVLEVTTNGFENFKLSFTMLSPNFVEFYVDDIQFKTLSGRCFDFDLTTCWNPKANNNAGEFSCSSNSYAYLYKYNKNESSPMLRGKFYALAELIGSWIDDSGVNNYIDSRVSLIPPTGNLPVCNATNISYSCGDGSVTAPEICEVGDSINYCEGGKQWYSPAVSLCQTTGNNACMSWNLPTATPVCSGKTMAQCCGGYCGDGVLNKAPNYRLLVNEQCDSSVRTGEKGYGAGSGPNNQYLCSQTCHDIGGYCGDNAVQIQFGEQCDQNTGLSEWSCSNGSIPTCNGCRVTCNSGTPYRGLCGNNIVENGEDCDFCGNGLQSVPGQGECNGSSITNQYFCNPAGNNGQCKWTGGYCGDAIINTVNGRSMEYCDQLDEQVIIPSGNNVRACVNSCQRFSCIDNFYDCDANAFNGCEINGHQGRWVNKISQTPASAPTPATYQQSDPSNKELINCGGCAGRGGSICAWVPNSIPICSTGKCKLTCINGYTDENKVYEDGCEKIGVNISGKILNDEQRGIQNANVYLIYNQPNNKYIFGTVTTNQNGEYSFIGLEKANYKIVVAVSDYDTSIYEFNVSSSENITKNFTLSPGTLRLSGVVYGTSSSFLSNKKVNLFSKSSAELNYKLQKTIYTNSEGVYTFNNIGKNNDYKVEIEEAPPYYPKEYIYGVITSSKDAYIGMDRCGDNQVNPGYEVCDGTSILFSCFDIFTNSDFMTPAFSSYRNRDWDGYLTCNASCKSFDFAGLNNTATTSPDFTINYLNNANPLTYVFNYNLKAGGDCSYGPPRVDKSYRLIKTNDIADSQQTSYIKNLEGKDCWFRARETCSGDNGVNGPGSIYYGSSFYIPREAQTWHKGKIVFNENASIVDGSVYCKATNYHDKACPTNANACSLGNNGKIYSSRLCWIEK